MRLEENNVHNSKATYDNDDLSQGKKKQTQFL
jgi:hypothetical protein